MCGRFTLLAEATDLEAVFTMSLGGLQVDKRYNIAPGQWLIVIRPARNGGREAALAQWGLVPSWTKRPASGPRPFNARAEGLPDKATFRGAFRHGRCLIPASGYYEWKPMDGRRQPFHLQLRSGGLMAFAGLYSEWAGPEGELPTCAIITVAASGTAASVHERMPLILPPELWQTWLDLEAHRPEALLAPPADAGLVAFPVGAAVNRVGSEGPELLTRVPLPQPLILG
nr:SOS response-associated peptidase [uncultured Holophaga sp.]